MAFFMISIDSVFGSMRHLLHGVRRVASFATNRLWWRFWRRYETPRGIILIGLPRSGTTLAKRYLGDRPGLWIAPGGQDVYAQWKEGENKAKDRITIVKSTRLLKVLHELYNSFGNRAWYLCILRDPRDQLISLFEVPDYHQEIPRDASFWDAWVENLEQFEQFVPYGTRRGTQVSLMRYEDLVALPVAMKIQFLRWLGLNTEHVTDTYQPVESMRHEFSGEDHKTHRQSKVHSDSVGRHTSEQDPKKRALLDGWNNHPAAKTWMQSLGYAPSAAFRLSIPGLTVFQYRNIHANIRTYFNQAAIKTGR